mmetsp:Transcript_50710/g.64960  ORF Transcript_50710/g.64960 Transcript_50710/m.64960 type:complete len:312 (+) Transcript_50710:195-1130(+)
MKQYDDSDHYHKTIETLGEKIEITENALKEQKKINQDLSEAVGALGQCLQENSDQNKNHNHEMLVMESILRDRLGHFKLEKDTYNTHLYELKQDYTLAQKNMLCLQNGGDVARGDLIFYVGNKVRAARIGGYLATAGISAFYSRDDWSGNRLGEVRVRSDDLTQSELCALFHKCLKDENSSFTLNRIKEYIRETGLRVAEYAYCTPRNKAVPRTMFAVFIELEPVAGLTSHHGIQTVSQTDHQGGGGGGGEGDNDDSCSGSSGGSSSTLSSRISNVSASVINATSGSHDEVSPSNPFQDPYQNTGNDDFGV